MKSYETVVLISADGGETQIKEDIKKIEGILSSKGAKSVSVDRWGTKVLGYRMKGKTVAHYAAFKFESENTQLPNDVAGVLRITDSVLKFQTHALGLPKRKFKGRLRPNSNVSGAEIDDIDEVDLS